MIPQIIIDNLDATGVFGQVAAAPLATQAGALSTADELVALLDSAFQQHVYAVSMGSNADYPSVVYQLVSAQTIQSGGYALARADRYVLQARGETLPALVAAVDQAMADMASSSHGIEVVDMLMDIDATLNLYRCNIELVFTVPAAGSALPAAFVVPLGWQWQPSEYGNCERQQATGKYAVVILSAGDDLVNLETNTRQALQGAQQGAAYAPFELHVSEPLQHPGGLMLWQLIISQDHIEGE